MIRMVLKYNPRTGKFTGKFTGKLNRKKLQTDAHNDHIQDKWKKQAQINEQGRL